MGEHIELTNEMQFSYAVGFIHLLDFVQRTTPGADPNQGLMKKIWLTKQAADLLLPGYSAEEVKGIIEAFNHAQVHEKLIAVMQQKVDRDTMMRKLKDSGFGTLDDRLNQLS